MKEVTLRIPDKKLSFFMDLMQQLGFEVLEDVNIPEEHQAMVRERIKKSTQNPERLMDWDAVKDNLSFD